MVDRTRDDATMAEELDRARQEAERLRWINARTREASEADLIEEADTVEQADRLRWINAHIREASEADLIEDADVIEDEDGLPVPSQT